jgi:hypothetical protein
MKRALSAWPRCQPYRGERRLSEERLTQLDKLYRSVAAALDQLVAAVGIKIAA